MKIIIFVAFLIGSYILSYGDTDDKVIYNGVFNGTFEDNGHNHQAIKYIFFINVRDAIRGLNDKNGHPRGPFACAYLLDNMLRLRAFCDQRSGTIKLTPAEMGMLEAIRHKLEALNLHFYAGEMPQLAKFCSNNEDSIYN